MRASLALLACLLGATSLGWAQGDDSPPAVEKKVSSTEPRDQAQQDVLKQAAPVVTYQGGRLTIDAENESLAGVLKLIAEKTGAVIDVPAGTGSERVVAHAGPGQASEVLKELLEGSEYNFVVLCSQQPTHELHEVLLTVRPGGAAFDANLASVQPTNRPTPVAAAAARPPAVTAATIPDPDKPPMSHEDMLKARAEWFRQRALQKPQKQGQQPQVEPVPPQEMPATLPTPVVPQ